MSENKEFTNIENKELSEDDINNLENDKQYSKKLLVIINPNSGIGDSEQIYFTEVLPYFEKHTDYKLDCFISRYSNHIDNYIFKNKDSLVNYDSLIVMGGDGMMHLTLNSLLKHKLDISLGIIPFGSGNGLVKSIFYERCREEYTSLDCYDLIKEYSLKKLIQLMLVQDLVI